MKYNAIQSIEIKTFSTEHIDFLNKLLMNIACTKENISVVRFVNKIKQSTFYSKATLKAVNIVFSVCLVTSDSVGFWITAYRKSGLRQKRTFCWYNRLCIFIL